MTNPNQFLFVCRENIGRSQVAMTYYNALSGNQALSAGITVDNPGETLGARPEANEVIQAMQEEGHDITSNVRTPLTPGMLSVFSKVIVLAEMEVVPPWVKDSPFAEFWDIEDMKGLDLARTRQVRDIIKDKIVELSE